MTKEFCTFYVNAHRLAVEVSRVQEILTPPQVFPVPLSPPHVLGLCNLRGQILLVWDLRRVLGLPPITQSEPIHVVVRVGEERLAWAVDSVGDVLTVTSDALVPPPENLTEFLREKLAGVCLLPGETLLVLDTQNILEAAASTA